MTDGVAIIWASPWRIQEFLGSDSGRISGFSERFSLDKVI